MQERDQGFVLCGPPDPYGPLLGKGCTPAHANTGFVHELDVLRRLPGAMLTGHVVVPPREENPEMVQLPLALNAVRHKRPMMGSFLTAVGSMACCKNLCNRHAKE